MSAGENPYQSPSPPRQAAPRTAAGVRSGRHEDLRRVAVYQKGILVCILIYLLAFIGQLAALIGEFALAAKLPSETAVALLGVAMIPVILAATVLVFLLTIQVYGRTAAVLLGILALIPWVGLFVWLTVNSKATAVLRANGHKVGLLGADLDEFND